MEKHKAVSEVLQSACAVTRMLASYIEDEKFVSKKDASEKGSMNIKEEN